MTQSGHRQSHELTMSKNLEVSWPTITVEGGAIIVSILLAFSIQAWWDERQDRQSEIDYLIALQKDFSETRESLENQVDRVVALFDQVDQVLSVIADTKTTNLPDAFSEMVGQAYLIPRPVSVTSTYEDMVNSGSLSLLRNEDLRVAMAEFMSILKIVEFHSNMNVQTYWTLHAPFINQHLLMNEFGWNAKDNEGADRDVTYMVGPAIKHLFRLNVDAVRTQEFWNLMIGWKALHNDQLIQVIRARNLSTEILSMLNDGIESDSR